MIVPPPMPSNLQPADAYGVPTGSRFWGFDEPEFLSTFRRLSAKWMQKCSGGQLRTHPAVLAPARECKGAQGCACPRRTARSERGPVTHQNSATRCSGRVLGTHPAMLAPTSMTRELRTSVFVLQVDGSSYAGPSSVFRSLPI